MSKTLEHFDYLSDRVKLERYRSAIEQVVQPGHVVLDLGCGSGVLGLFALRAGAGKVFFVEQDAVLEMARQAVANAGFSDKSEFIHGNSYELALPGKADVVVCDHVGYFGFDYGVLELLADARQRFLKPGGVLVPAQIDLKLAPVESEDCRKFISQWRDGRVPDEFAFLGVVAANTKHATQLNGENLLAEAATLASLELGVEAAPYYAWQAEFTCARDGKLDGIAGWFECQLFGDVHMCNSPMDENSLNRPQAFLPLDAPVEVGAGEQLNVTVMARPAEHIIGWVIDLPATGRRFAHNTFGALPLDAETLTRVRPDRKAAINARGRARQLVLSYCDGHRTVAEVQALVLKDHPQLFPSAHATSAFVTQVLSWDTSE